MVALRFASLFLLYTSLTVLATKLPSRAAAAKGPTPPPLNTWAENALATVIKATSVSALDTAFDAVLSQDVTIAVNAMSLSRADYIAKRQSQGFDTAAKIVYSQALEAPTVANSSAAGEVALYFVATIGANVVTSSMNLVIGQDTTLSPPPTDSRRVNSINQILTETS
ncbi:hypothetical protein C8F04DRAFT_1401287 [Mycena alexandri]|uniref:Uncharacterized protein n=1 Tax=Mycena alexandri TaxID=1745969 RepID=A0AAD6SAI2_9AGAR|nr:hypothetical protein C8F04DRAFT_1401287 [Mycena alexandri]